MILIKSYISKSKYELFFYEWNNLVWYNNNIIYYILLISFLVYVLISLDLFSILF